VAIPPGVRFLPNAITVLALCAGLSSIAFAHRATLEPAQPNSQWFLAAALIATAAVLDSLDGPAARMLHSTSRIGAELDSFSDLVSFGIAPAVVMYLWKLDMHPVGWAICLVYAVCTTLRLARFNSALDDDNPKPWSKMFFTGVPSPAGALLAVQPMLLWWQFGEGWWSNQWVTASWMLFIGILMISRMPSIALKYVYIPSSLVLPSLVGLVIGVALAFYQPVVMLGLGLLVYLAHLPYAWWKRQRVRRNPELWSADRRRRIRARSTRLRPRMPQRRRVAGRARDGRRLPELQYRQRQRTGGQQTPAPNPSGTSRRLGRRRLR